MNEPKAAALELKSVQKSYGGARALRDGNLLVAAGSIHGVVGPNGAGKSTLIKIASGQVHRDAGEILVNGEAADLRGVPDALAHGIVAMPQELTVVPSLSVAENITLGREAGRWGLVRGSDARRAAVAVLDRMKVKLRPQELVGKLEPATQRVVMLARAVHTGAHTVILDEPTAALTSAQAEVFLGVVRSLRTTGVAVVYISHRFREIEELCDEVTILRDGRTVDVLTGSRRTQRELVAAVVTEGAVVEPIKRHARPENPEVALSAHQLTGERLRGVNVELRQGEVVGLCGLPGSGMNELMEILGGSAQPASGTLKVHGQPVRFGEPADALAHGVTYLPVERARAGMLDLSLRANLIASSLPHVSHAGLITAKAERSFVSPVMTELNLQRRVDEPLRALSGGNRQKVLLSRCLLADARVVVLDDPTVGVDVGARHDIHQLLARFADEGRTVVVGVSEPEELVSIADRVLVLSRGEVAIELQKHEITAEALVRAVTTSQPLENTLDRAPTRAKEQPAAPST